MQIIAGKKSEVISGAISMGSVPRGAALNSLAQEGRQKKHRVQRKAWRELGVTLKSRRLLSNTYLWWRHWLMDWARSAAPPDGKASAAHTHGPETSRNTHTHTHRVERTADETTLCQHMVLSAMLMKFIWIHADPYRRGKGKMKRGKGRGKKTEERMREAMTVM